MRRIYLSLPRGFLLIAAKRPKRKLIASAEKNKKITQKITIFFLRNAVWYGFNCPAFKPMRFGRANTIILRVPCVGLFRHVLRRERRVRLGYRRKSARAFDPSKAFSIERRRYLGKAFPILSPR